MRIDQCLPIGRGVAPRRADQANHYNSSQCIAENSLGAHDPRFNTRCESREALTFPDRSFGLLITQDVMKHIPDPDRAFQEIARVMTPGVAHLFTVPMVQTGEPSRPILARWADRAHFTARASRRSCRRCRFPFRVGLEVRYHVRNRGIFRNCQSHHCQRGY